MLVYEIRIVIKLDGVMKNEMSNESCNFVIVTLLYQLLNENEVTTKSMSLKATPFCQKHIFCFASVSVQLNHLYPGYIKRV